MFLQQMTPIDKQEDADDEKPGHQSNDGFPGGFPVEQTRQISAGVFAGINHRAVGEQSADEKRRQNVPGIDAGGGGGGKERRSRKRRQGIEEDKDRGRPDGARELAADVSQISVLAAVDDF